MNSGANVKTRENKDRTKQAKNTRGDIMAITKFEIRDNAERLLSKKYGTRVQLGEPWECRFGINEKAILRCDVMQPDYLAPSVILKQIQSSTFNPDDPKSVNGMRFLNDWAGRQFLNSLLTDSLFSARFLAGDRATGLTIIEDLGAENSFINILTRTPNSADEFLIRLLIRLGEMHNRSIGLNDNFVKIRKSLGPFELSPQHMYANFVNSKKYLIKQLANDYGFGSISELSDELEALSRGANTPDQFLGYVHGNISLGHAFDTDIGIRFIDFESGGYGQVLLDLANVYTSFQLHSTTRKISDDTLDSLTSAYKNELLPSSPQTLGEINFQKAFIEAFSSRLLMLIILFFEQAFQKKYPIDNDALSSQIGILSRLLERSFRSCGHLPYLREFLILISQNARAPRTYL